MMQLKSDSLLSRTLNKKLELQNNYCFGSGSNELTGWSLNRFYGAILTLSF